MITGIPRNKKNFIYEGSLKNKLMKTGCLKHFIFMFH